jgi:CHASE2 domain-containing sensor protein
MRILKTDWTFNRTAALRGALLSGAVGVVLLMSPLGLWFTQFSYDLAFVLRPAATVDEAAIIYLDEKAHRDLNQPVQGQWDRSLHVRLLRELTARNAKGVVFDLLFDRPWQTPAVDAELAAAMRTNGHVILAASRSSAASAGQPEKVELTRAVEPIASAAAWGVVEMPTEADERIRRHYSDALYTNLSWQAASLLGKAPEDSAKERWINYYGPPGTIPHLSYAQVLEAGAIDPDFFTNKMVFVGVAPIIGYQGTSSGDQFSTPYTRWTGAKSTGVEIHATSFLNLVRADWLTRLPAGAEIGLVLLLGLAAGFGLSGCRPAIAAAVALAVILGLPLLAASLVWLTHIWFSWAIVAAVQVPVALGCKVIDSLRRQLPKEAAAPQTPKVPVAAPSDAIFISYSHEDELPVLELKEHLEAAGLEVWLDRRRLEAGDEYEREIRRSIKRCALFVPVISRNTETRDEGFFRKEWRWAVERLETMTGSSRPFLMPLVVDGTPAHQAKVPPEFVKYQWATAPGGVPPAEWIAKLKSNVRDLRKPQSVAA